MRAVCSGQLFLSVPFPQYPPWNERRGPVGIGYLRQWGKQERIDDVIVKEEAKDDGKGSWSKVAQTIGRHCEE